MQMVGCGFVHGYGLEAPGIWEFIVSCEHYIHRGEAHYFLGINARSGLLLGIAPAGLDGFPL